LEVVVQSTLPEGVTGAKVGKAVFAATGGDGIREAFPPTNNKTITDLLPLGERNNFDCVRLVGNSVGYPSKVGAEVGSSVGS
jgi:hypothetical protein